MYLIHFDYFLLYSYFRPSKPLPVPFFPPNLFPTFTTDGFIQCPTGFNLGPLCGHKWGTAPWALAGSLVVPQLATVPCHLSQNLFLARIFSQNIISSSAANDRPHVPQPHPKLTVMWALLLWTWCRYFEFAIAWPYDA